MKRINILLAVIFSMTVVACSNSPESVAKRRVRPLTEIYVNDPNSLIIQEKEVMVSNDSLCVIQYLAKSKNRYGGYETDKMEYVCAAIRDNNGRLLPDLYEYTQSIGGTRCFRTILNYYYSSAYDDDKKAEIHYKNAVKLLKEYGNKVP